METLGKSYSVDILAATSEPRSAQELSDELDIPIATCYRRVEELADRGLLETENVSRARTVTVYQRSVDRLCTEFTEPVSLSPDHQSRVQTAIDSVWQQVT